MIDYSVCKHKGKKCSWSNYGECGPIQYLYEYNSNFNKPTEVLCEKHYQDCSPQQIGIDKFKPLRFTVASPSWFDNLPEVEG